MKAEEVVASLCEVYLYLFKKHTEGRVGNGWCSGEGWVWLVCGGGFCMVGVGEVGVCGSSGLLFRGWEG